MFQEKNTNFQKKKQQLFNLERALPTCKRAVERGIEADVVDVGAGQAHGVPAKNEFFTIHCNPVCMVAYSWPGWGEASS